MKIQILRMRQVYSAPKCTIAAVSADSINVGSLGKNEGNPPGDGTSSCRTAEELESLLEPAPSPPEARVPGVTKRSFSIIAFLRLLSQAYTCIASASS